MKEPETTRLNRNENPYAWPHAALVEVLRRVEAEGLNRYPGGVDRLIAALAQHLGLRPEQIVPGAGSDENIQGVILGLTSPGGVVVAPRPTFTMYRNMAARLGRRYVEVRSSASFAPSGTAIVEAADLACPGERALIFLPRPDNPTGAVASSDVVDELAASRHYVVIDEAYAEFSDCTLLPDGIDHPRRVILRTFSKSFALAGARLGYACANEALADRLRKAALPHNVSTFTLHAALVALERKDEAWQWRDRIVQERSRLADALAQRPGFQPLPSDTNFVLVHVDEAVCAISAKALTDELASRDVFVRRWEMPELDEYFRVTIGTAAESERFLVALDAACADRKGAKEAG